MGDAVASITTRARTMEADFALIGHQESWRAAADVLAVLRGPERTRLPDDELKDILPWIPPEQSAMSTSNRSWGRKRVASTSTPSFLPIVWKPPTCTRTSPAFEGRRPARSRQERRS